MAEILHLMRRADFEAQAGEAVVVGCPPDSFIHCTATAEVLRHVANAVFQDTPGEFVVLVVDTNRLQAEVRWEPPEPTPPAGSPLATVLFPHVFGDLTRDAVVAVRAAVRGAGGEFLQT